MSSSNPASYYIRRKCDPVIWLIFINICQIFLSITKYVTLLLFGWSITDGTSEEHEKSKEYEHSAHMGTVWARLVQNIP